MIPIKVGVPVSEALAVGTPRNTSKQKKTKSHIVILHQKCGIQVVSKQKITRPSEFLGL